jgi:hypothetical protein
MHLSHLIQARTEKILLCESESISNQATVSLSKSMFVENRPFDEHCDCVSMDVCQCSLNMLPLDHILLDRSPNIGPLISRWELDKFKNC